MEYCVACMGKIKLDTIVKIFGFCRDEYAIAMVVAYHGFRR